MTNTIIFHRWVDILANLNTVGNESMHRLSRDLDITYSHITKIIKEMERLNWINTKKKGRERIIKLTGKGEEMKNSIMPVILELKKKRTLYEV